MTALSATARRRSPRYRFFRSAASAGAHITSDASSYGVAMAVEPLKKRDDLRCEAAIADCWRSAHALSERLLEANSSTLELERWCREQGLGDGRISIRCNRDAAAPPLDQASLSALKDPAENDIVYRSVQLVTVGTVLVDADNWYFPARLTSDMRRALETTDISFGRIIAPLQPLRRTFLVKRCTPAELEHAHAAVHDSRPRGPGTALSRPDHVFEHRALIHLSDETPVAVVHERYRAAVVCEYVRKGEPCTARPNVFPLASS
jgi:hypothetical protein